MVFFSTAVNTTYPELLVETTDISMCDYVKQSAVMMSCKVPATQDTAIKDYRFLLAEQMFHSALNQRLFKISRQKDPPFFSCVSSSEHLVRPIKAYIMSANCQERGTLQALEQMLTEVRSSSTSKLGVPSNSRSFQAVLSLHMKGLRGVTLLQ